MNPTKTSDIKNIGNISVDELAYLQNKLTRYTEHLLDHARDRIRESEAAQRADRDSVVAMTSNQQTGRTKEAEANQRATRDNMMAVALASGIASLNLNPSSSLAALLGNIGYSSSAADALNKDWQNVGNDLWKSWAAIKNEHE